MSISKLHSDILATICGLIDPADLQLMKGKLDVVHFTKCGYLSIIKHLHAIGCDLSQYIINIISGDHLDALQWVNDSGYNVDICTYAMNHSSLSILQWALDNGYTLDTDICLYAISRGDLNMLQLAKSNGRWNRDACLNAAFHGNLHVLQWLRANECPWDIHTCEYAVARGHLDVFIWARDNGCPCTDDMYEQAIKNNNLRLERLANK